MQIKIWGTRGSTPVSGAQFSQYGGNTSCIEVTSVNGDSLILDAGTGLGALGRAANGKNGTPVICLTHPHLDHIQGLPFFSPIYSGKVIVYGPKGVEKQIERLFDGVFHPVQKASLPRLEIRELAPGESFNIGDLEVETIGTNHPGESIAYKIKADGQTFVYTGDHEIPLGEDEAGGKLTADLLKFIEGSDVVLADAHFSAKDHAQHPGWGHSHPEQWINLLKDKKVGKILFGHYNPEFTDADIDNFLQAAIMASPDLDAHGARERMIIKDGEIIEGPDSGNCPICEFFKKTAPLSDTHAVLDAVLTEARKMGNAEAGTVYLVQDGELAFSAAQNDALFPASKANKFFYMNARIPIDKTSIAGYVVATGKSLNITDVYNLPSGSEFGFKVDFDKKTGYRTQSVLAVPLLNARKETIGVLQLINSMKDGKVVPFTPRMAQQISSLAAMATVPLERSFLLTSMILRMLRTSALRDPTETAGHVYRVGAMAAELYHHWAEKKGVDPEELLSTKGVLRLAAMLHDVGKIGIPDSVLKKPGRLDDQERSVMQKHAAMGAQLFDDGEDGIDQIAREIALHHHAKWDGSGYTGDNEINSPAKDDIPIWARITAIADVYDALVSRRCYKEPWDSAKALEILQKDAGTHFDPELVQDFIEIKDVVDAIMRRYQ